MLLADSAQPLAVPHSGTPATTDGVRVRELSATTILVTAFGEVDAASAADLSDRIEGHLTGYHQLVLDLSRLSFFGIAGYTILNRVHTRCARAGVDWVVVPGPEVERLLRVCDPDTVVPTAPNIVAAVAVLARSHTRQLG